MKRSVCGLALALLVIGVVGVETLHAQTARPRREADGISGSVRVVFSTGDVRIIRQHYATRYRNLPPGLQKKYERTGTLPPGWQKKLEPFPVALERNLTALPREYRRGVIDGQAVIIDGRTNVVLDVAVLF